MADTRSTWPIKKPIPHIHSYSNTGSSEKITVKILISQGQQVKNDRHALFLGIILKIKST